MPASGSLTAAGDNASANAIYVWRHATALLKTQLGAWIAAIQATLTDPSSVAQRSVLDWIPLLRLQQENTPAGSDGGADAVDLAQVTDIGVLLFRTCRAMSTALSQTRITNAQATALLASYNAIWFPP